MTLALLNPRRSLNSPNCHVARPIGARTKVMLHFDDSSNDGSAVEWFTDPACHVSYNRLYLRSGDVVAITPSIESAAWHAGVCRTENANRLFYGLAIAGNDTKVATPEQLEAIACDCAALFALNKWPALDVDTRITGHEDEACFADGKIGRKIDPTGSRPERPVLSKTRVRARVAELLNG